MGWILWGGVFLCSCSRQQNSEVSCKAKHMTMLWVVFIMFWFHTEMSTCWFAGDREVMIQTSVDRTNTALVKNVSPNMWPGNSSYWSSPTTRCKKMSMVYHCLPAVCCLLTHEQFHVLFTKELIALINQALTALINIINKWLNLLVNIRRMHCMMKLCITYAWYRAPIQLTIHLTSPDLTLQSPPKESIHLRQSQVLKIEGG